MSSAAVGEEGEYYHGELETRANCLRLWETRAWLWSLSCGTWRRFWFTHRLFPVHAGHLTHLKMSQICKKKKKRGTALGVLSCQLCSQDVWKSSAGVPNLRPIFKSDFAHVSQRLIMNPKPHNKQREPLPLSSSTTHQTPRCLSQASCSAVANASPVSKPS